jgi:hypothetical protein
MFFADRSGVCFLHKLLHTLHSIDKTAATVLLRIFPQKEKEERKYKFRSKDTVSWLYDFKLQ